MSSRKYTDNDQYKLDRQRLTGEEAKMKNLNTKIMLIAIRAKESSQNNTWALIRENSKRDNNVKSKDL